MTTEIGSKLNSNHNFQILYLSIEARSDILTASSNFSMIIFLIFPSASCSKVKAFLRSEPGLKMRCLVLDVCRLIKSCWNNLIKLVDKKLTTCSRLVIIKPNQMIWTHLDISLMVARQQACRILTATCAFLYAPEISSWTFVLQITYKRKNEQLNSLLKCWCWVAKQYSTANIVHNCQECRSALWFLRLVNLFYLHA